MYLKIFKVEVCSKYFLMFESIRIKLDRRNISKIVSVLPFLSEILGLVSLWRFMGTVAMGMAVYMKRQLCVTVAASDCARVPPGKQRQLVPRWAIHNSPQELVAAPLVCSCWSLLPRLFSLLSRTKMLTVILQKLNTAHQEGSEKVKRTWSVMSCP